MYSSLLIIAGVALFLSSITTLFLLLKIIIRQTKRCPFYVLAISDILISSLIAMILIVTGQDEIHNGDYIEDKRDITRQDCNSQYVLKQHALFVVPMTDTFISLLCKFLQCNDNIVCLDKQCGKIVMHDKSVDTDKTIKLPRRQKYTTTLGVASQWFMPLAIITSLYTSGYEKLDSLISTHELPCIYASNFPMDNCYNNVNDTALLNETDYFNPFINQQTDNLEAIDLPNTSLAMTDEIVTRIHEIVGSVFSTTDETGKDISIYNDALRTHNTSVYKLDDLIHEKIQILDENELIKMISINRHGKDFYTREQLPECMKNQCLLSPNILKIQLSFLLFIIYFGTILLTCILYVRFDYIYHKIMEKMQIFNTTVGQESTSIEPAVDDVKSKIASTSLEEAQSHETLDEQTTKHMEPLHNINEQMTKVKKFYQTLKIYFYLAILMWTPLFIQILVKVFFCYHITCWFINIMYLLAITFGIVRNILNLRVIKTNVIVPHTDTINNKKQKLTNITVDK